MPVVNELLERELEYVTNQGEQDHIRALWDDAHPLMQEISVNLIQDLLMLILVIIVLH